jgi:hypothetical protein
MKINVITSLARPQNISDIINHLKDKEVTLHLITDEDADFDINVTESWVKHYVCPNKGSEFWERCHSALNWFFATHIPDDENYYCVMNDDDGYEDEFFNKLINSINESNNNKQPNDLIICSMLRGHNIPKEAIPVRRHPTTTLMGVPSNMRVGSVGLEQFIIKGNLLRKHKIPLTTCGDGELIQKLTSEYNALYLPDLYVKFNYFEPGRWNN